MRISDWSSDVCSSDLRSSPERLLSRRASASSGGRTCQGRSLSMSMLFLEGRTISVSGPFHGRASFRLARRGRVLGRIEEAWPVGWPNGRIDGAFAERHLPEPVFGRGDIMKIAVFSTKNQKGV